MREFSTLAAVCGTFLLVLSTSCGKSEYNEKGSDAPGQEGSGSAETQGSATGRLPEDVDVTKTSTSSKKVDDPEALDGGASGNTQPASDGCIGAEPMICNLEAAILKYTNEYRAGQGLDPLVLHSKLSYVARDWSLKQEAVGDISHDGFPASRENVYKSNFNSLDVRILGENVAYGQDQVSLDATAKGLVDAWYASSSHREMILGSFTVIGIGISYDNGAVYATQIFGSLR